MTDNWNGPSYMGKIARINRAGFLPRRQGHGGEIVGELLRGAVCYPRLAAKISVGCTAVFLRERAIGTRPLMAAKQVRCPPTAATCLSSNERPPEGARPGDSWVRLRSRPASRGRQIRKTHQRSPLGQGERAVRSVLLAQRHSSIRLATSAVHPVWWLAPMPAPLSPWKYS